MQALKTFFRAGAITMLITMLVGEVLHFWALTFTTAYSVLAFIGYLGLVYASPSVDQKIRAPEPTIDEDARMKRISLVPFIPRRAKALVHDQAVDWAA
jgi:hypothetical protein